MTLGISTTIDTGRSIMSALQPLTGTRARGQIRLFAKSGNQVTIPAFTFFMPVLDGQRHTSYLFKTIKGPNSDDSWTITDSGSLVDVVSNIGGVRHNIDQDTSFQTDIPHPDLVLTGAQAPTAVADFVDGTEPQGFGGVRDMVLYDTFDGPDIFTDIHRSPLGQFPGVLLAFQDFEPADGVAIAQNNQSAINAGTDKKFYKVSYTINVLTQRGEGDAARRQEGLLIADTIMQLLNDKHAGDPGECLSNPGGVQVRTMFRGSGPQPVYQKFYVYTILVSAMVTLKRLDFRSFNPWLRTLMNVDVPQEPKLPNQGTFELINDVEIDMTPNSIDLAPDGTFTRATTANLWAPEVDAQGVGQLLPFASGERRVTNSSLGVMMEPTVTNSVDAAAEDLTAWTAAGGAAVVADQENDPLDALTADRIDFAADADSQLTLAGQTVTALDPVIVQVFAKAPGNKFTSRMRIAVVDSSATEHVSEDLEIGPVWDLYRFEFIPIATGALSLRLKNASDAMARQVMVWGVNYSNDSRWGAEYPGTGTKFKDELTFTPLPVAGQQANLVTPQAALTGRWALRFLTPGEVTPDLIGTGSGATERVLVSVGDGVTELVILTLIGTPASGGAAFTLDTRGGGSQISLAGLEWTPGDLLTFTVDATGMLTVEGTLNGDGDYPFDRYVEDGTTSDFMAIGDRSTGLSSPAPGRYVAIDVNV